MQENAALRAEVADAKATIQRNESRYAGIDMVYEAYKTAETQLAEKASEVARLTAEVERVTKDGDFHQKFAEKALARCCEQNSTIVDLRQQLAVTTERLAAAERLVGAYRHYKAVEVIGYSVYIKENGKNGDSPYAELFRSLHEFAKGWLPADGVKGGGGLLPGVDRKLPDGHPLRYSDT
jgi:chromosome segregation ATPase